MKKITIITLLLIYLCACGTNNTNVGKVRMQMNEWKSANPNVFLEDENVGGMKGREIKSKIQEYAKEIDYESKNAVLTEETWEIKQEESSGKKVDIEKTFIDVMSANEGSKIYLTVNDIQPQVTSKILDDNIVNIGEFTTPILDKNPARVNNIKLASQKIDYTKLHPGKEFSFNNTVGRRTESKGFEQAPIIVKSPDGYEKGYGVGGGVCQLSTTIFNAVENASLEVTERHIHTKNVGYIEQGEDATVSYGSVDLRFKNNRQNPIMIRTYMTSSLLGVKILENKNIPLK